MHGLARAHTTHDQPAGDRGRCQTHPTASRHLGVPRQAAVFAGLRKPQLRLLARWGEVITVPAGEVLLREEHGDFWFYVLLAGRVGLARRGAGLASVAPGGYFGEAAIVGLRPQPATATTLEPSTLFVLGAQQLISLLSEDSGFRRSLLPQVEPGEYRQFVRRQHEIGRVEWRRLTPPAASVCQWQPAWRARGRPRGAARLSVLSAGRPIPPSGRLSPSPVPPRRLRRASSIVAVGALVALATVLLAYHPPRAVITAGPPVDVSADVQVSGATGVRHPAGHYLLLWVRARRPNLLGYLAASAEGARTVPARQDHRTGAQRAAARRLDRGQYLDSQTRALDVAARIAGVDSRLASVTIRDRGLTGPSAGLAYALALTDALTGRDLSHGRVVAATGELASGGALSWVGWVGIKARAAGTAGAEVVLVPSGQEYEAVGSVPSIGVTDVLDAIRVLSRP